MSYIRLVERWESPLFVCFVISGLNTNFTEVLNLNCNVQRYRYEAGSHEIGEDDLRTIREQLNSRVSENDDYWNDYKKQCESCGCLLLKVAEQICQNIPEIHQPIEFCNPFNVFAHASKRMTPFLVSTVILEKIFEEKLRIALCQEEVVKRDLAKLEYILAELRACAAPNQPIYEMRACATFARDISKEPQLKERLLKDSIKQYWQYLQDKHNGLAKRIQDHVHQYGWITTHGYRYYPMTPEGFLERIRIMVVNDRIPAMRGIAQRRSLNEIIGEQFSQKLELMIGHLENMIALRFYRINIHLQAYAISRKFYEKMAESLNCTWGQLAFCTEDEILCGLSGESRIPCEEELKHRMEKPFSIELQRNRLVFRTVEKGEPVKSAGMPIIIHGATGNQGKHEGRAIVVHNAEDCLNVEKGDVLITGMTTPDFVPALERCGAVVTDEGGMLCHAAVVCRELNIPCIIGTGNATRLTTEGSQVFVESKDHGAVAILISKGVLEGSWHPRILANMDSESYDRVQLGKLMKTLRGKLLADYSQGGPYAGQFGALHRTNNNESGYHQRDSENAFAVSRASKPDYYLTYWGFKVASFLLPEYVASWSNLTAQRILERFDNRDWIKVEETVNDDPPYSDTFESIRYSVRAAQILLLIYENITNYTIKLDVMAKLRSFVIKLIQPQRKGQIAPFHYIKNGFRRNLLNSNGVCLYTTIYAYGFLRTITSARYDAYMGNAIDAKHKQNIEDILRNIEKGLLSAYRSNKWEYGSDIWWPDKTSLFLAELLEYRNSDLRAPNRDLTDPLNPVLWASYRDLTELIESDIKPPQSRRVVCRDEQLKLRIVYSILAAQPADAKLSDGLKGLVRAIIGVAAQQGEEWFFNTQEVAYLPGFNGEMRQANDRGGRVAACGRFPNRSESRSCKPNTTSS